MTINSAVITRDEVKTIKTLRLCYANTVASILQSDYVPATGLNSAPSQSNSLDTVSAQNGILFLIDRLDLRLGVLSARD